MSIDVESDRSAIIQSEDWSVFSLMERMMRLLHEIDRLDNN